MSTYFGGTSHASGGIDLSSNGKAVGIYSAPVSGQIDTARAWLDGSGTGSYQARFVVYSVVGGVPDTLLGFSDDITITNGQAAGLVTFTFTTPVSGIVSGTSYAIGVHLSSNAHNAVGFDTGGTLYFQTTDAFAGGSSSSWSNNNTFGFSIHAEAGITVAPATDASTIPTTTSPSSTELVSYVESTTVNTTTTPLGFDVEFIDLAEVDTLLRVSGVDQFVTNNEIKTVPFTTTVISVESQVHPSGSWGPFDTDDGIFVWP